MDEQLRRVRQQLLSEVNHADESAPIILYNGPVPSVIQRGRNLGASSTGIQYQRCGGGRRVVRKRLGGT